jgi:pimeloyl-ACP methyl ester carboxylesterase
VKLTLALTMALAFPAAARAQLDDAHCSSGAVGSVRTYLSVDGAFGDPRANDNGKIRLRGWVYIPTGTPPEGGFPVLVFNHGSEDTPAAKCVLADYFVAQKNFILFVPVRRGHTGSTEQADLFCPASICTDAMWSQFYRAFVSDYLKQQRQDVNEAVQYIRSNYPKANDSKFAVMGHSFGAIVSLFFNMLEGEKTQAVVSISASAQSWGQTDAGDYWQQQLRDAVRKAKRPTFFLAPKNDASTLPIAELSYEAALDKQRYQATIFSPVPDELLVCSDGSACPCDDPDNPGADQDVSCGDVAHGKFVSDETRVARWAPTVVEFLRRFGVR